MPCSFKNACNIVRACAVLFSRSSGISVQRGLLRQAAAAGLLPRQRCWQKSARRASSRSSTYIPYSGPNCASRLFAKPPGQSRHSAAGCYGNRQIPPLHNGGHKKVRLLGAVRDINQRSAAAGPARDFPVCVMVISGGNDQKCSRYIICNDAALKQNYRALFREVFYFLPWPHAPPPLRGRRAASSVCILRSATRQRRQQDRACWQSSGLWYTDASSHLTSLFCALPSSFS